MQVIFTQSITLFDFHIIRLINVTEGLKNALSAVLDAQYDILLIFCPILVLKTT